MVQIPLRNRRGEAIAYALVDDDDAAQAEHRWHLSAQGYAARYMRKSEGLGQLLMHRAILGLTRGDGLQCDHISRDGLDNRRSNLRVVTHAQNQQNQGARDGSTSPYRGVSWVTSRGVWRADGRHHGTHFLGYFASEEAAAAVASAFRAKYMPFSEDAAA
jgi:hypothetical protein